MAQPLAMLMEPFYTTAPGPAVPPQPQQNPQRQTAGTSSFIKLNEGTRKRGVA